MAIDPKIISRIQKLLALGTSSNVNESASAIAKAHALLLDYNLSMDEIKVRENVGRSYLREDVPLGRQRWRGHLAQAVCTNNLCTTVKLTGADRMAIIGEQHNIEACKLMIELITEQLLILATTAYRAALSDLPAVTWKDTFYYGAITTIDRRLKLDKEQAANNVRALIIVRDKELIVARDNFFNGRVRNMRAKRLRGNDAYLAGQRAGEQVRFRQEIN